MKKILGRTALAVLILALYLVTSIPVGLFLYTMKSDLGIDVFDKTGFHGYMHCLKEQAELIGKQ